MKDSSKVTKIINSLKSGIVPSENFREFLVGRDDEKKELNRILDNIQSDVGSIKFITGAYGSGKSSLLKYVMEYGGNNNFLISKISLDRGFKFYKLEELYYHIMHGLYYKGKNVSFDDLFTIWLDKVKEDKNNKPYNYINNLIKEITTYNESFGRVFFSYIRAKISNSEEEMKVMSSWLSGEPNIPYKIKEKYGIKGSIDRNNSVDYLKCFCTLIEILGFSGMVILIDEVDVLLDERSDLRQKSFVGVKGFIDMTVNSEFKNCGLIFSGGERFFVDDKGVKTYEALMQRLSYTEFTEKAGLMDYKKPVMWLRNIDLDSYYNLGEMIYTIYSSINDINLKISVPSVVNWVFLEYKKGKREFRDLTIRDFLIKYMEILDIISQNPENKIYTYELEASYNGREMKFKNRL
ncbi:MAG: ATP-binding protein [Firmicutes bacterium]|jgi:hypothetical protein|nr:ATP-binding protein [Bacillota bacterium]